MLFDDPRGSPALNMDSKSQSEKSSFWSFFVFLCSVLACSRNGLLCIPWGSPFACAHQNAWSVRENLQSPRRPAKNMRTLKNWPPKSSKCHFSWKFATSPVLPPYYSIEPMKYALRVIFWSRECLGMIPEASQPQIWTQSWNPKNHHFHHFCLTSKLKFGLWANLSFLLPLGLSFCMRSLK